MVRMVTIIRLSKASKPRVGPPTLHQPRSLMTGGLVLWEVLCREVFCCGSFYVGMSYVGRSCVVIGLMPSEVLFGSSYVVKLNSLLAYVAQ